MFITAFNPHPGSSPINNKQFGISFELGQFCSFYIILNNLKIKNFIIKHLIKTVIH